MESASKLVTTPRSRSPEEVQARLQSAPHLLKMLNSSLKRSETMMGLDSDSDDDAKETDRSMSDHEGKVMALLSPFEAMPGSSISKTCDRKIPGLPPLTISSTTAGGYARAHSRRASDAEDEAVSM